MQAQSLVASFPAVIRVILQRLEKVLHDNPNNGCKGVLGGLIVQMMMMLSWQHDQIYKIGV